MASADKTSQRCSAPAALRQVQGSALRQLVAQPCFVNTTATGTLHSTGLTQGLPLHVTSALATVSAPPWRGGCLGSRCGAAMPLLVAGETCHALRLQSWCLLASCLPCNAGPSTVPRRHLFSGLRASMLGSAWLKVSHAPSGWTLPTTLMRSLIEGCRVEDTDADMEDLSDEAVAAVNEAISTARQQVGQAGLGDMCRRQHERRSRQQRRASCSCLTWSHVLSQEPTSSWKNLKGAALQQ